MAAVLTGGGSLRMVCDAEEILRRFDLWAYRGYSALLQTSRHEQRATGC
jgi:hypothetical protein